MGYGLVPTGGYISLAMESTCCYPLQGILQLATPTGCLLKAGGSGFAKGLVHQTARYFFPLKTGIVFQKLKTSVLKIFKISKKVCDFCWLFLPIAKRVTSFGRCCLKLYFNAAAECRRLRPLDRNGREVSSGFLNRGRWEGSFDFS